MSSNAAVLNLNNAAMSASHPELDATSSLDSEIVSNFETLTAAEQGTQRDEWKSELSKAEEELLTLKQAIAEKQAYIVGLRRRLGITSWREFSEDMVHQGLKNLQETDAYKQGLKNLQESNAYKTTAESISAAKLKTASIWTSAAASVNASKEMLSLEPVNKMTENLGGWSTTFGGLTQMAGTALGAAKSKMADSLSHPSISDEAGNK